MEVELRAKRVKKANPDHHVNGYNFLNLSSMSHGYQIKLLENFKILSHFLSLFKSKTESLDLWLDLNF